MINVQHLKTEIIRPVLASLNMYSEAAVNLMVGTALVESELQHLKQIEGPALGIYQVEPFTHDDCWRNYLAHNNDIASVIRNYAGYRFKGTAIPAAEMIGNLYYATCIARIKYWRDPKPLPDSDNIEELALYWKRVYNSAQGKGDPGRFLKLYDAYANAYQ